MPNAVLLSLLAQRDEQIASMDAVLSRVEAEGRDLVDAERALLDASRQRIAELDAQIGPLEEFENLRAAHAERQNGFVPARPGPEDRPGRRAALDGGDRAPTYPSAGAFMVDLIRAGGFMERMGGAPDPQAAARVQQARAAQNQVTGDTPGLLPVPIVGQVVNLIDANRPLISSLGGAMALGNIPGLSFTRPKVTQHVQVGKQGAEKTELPSRPMKILPVPFVKETYGGAVDISRQDIDWTSPAAWDILIRDLADVYAIQVETVVAEAFATAAGGNTPEAVDAPTLEGWAEALYKAAARSYGANKKMPDRIWVSLDMWAALGALVDIARLVLPHPDNAAADDGAGSSELGSFRGDVIGLPRIVVPTFPEGTAIIGNSTVYEVYEEVIGLLSVIEPSILGVTVAYGGYVAYGAVESTGLIPITGPSARAASSGAAAPARK